MTIHKAKGSQLFIGPAVDIVAINAAADEAAGIAIFAALSGWNEVLEVEDMGEHGDSSEEITFTAIKDGRVRKVKGPRNAGTMAIVVARDPLDTGQLAFIQAEQEDANFAFKLVYGDSRGGAYTNSTEYFAGLVMSRPNNIGNVSNIVRRTFNVAINTACYEVESVSA